MVYIWIVASLLLHCVLASSPPDLPSEPNVISAEDIVDVENLVSEMSKEELSHSVLQLLQLQAELTQKESSPEPASERPIAVSESQETHSSAEHKTQRKHEITINKFIGGAVEHFMNQRARMPPGHRTSNLLRQYFAKKLQERTNLNAPHEANPGAQLPQDLEPSRRISRKRIRQQDNPHRQQLGPQSQLNAAVVLPQNEHSPPNKSQKQAIPKLDNQITQYAEPPRKRQRQHNGLDLTRSRQQDVPHRQILISKSQLSAAGGLPHIRYGTQYMHSHQPYVPPGQHPGPSGSLNAAGGLPHANGGAQYVRSHEPHFSLKQYLVISGQLNEAGGLSHSHHGTQYIPSNQPYVRPVQHPGSSDSFKAAGGLTHAYDGAQYLHNHQPHVPLEQYSGPRGQLNAAGGLPHSNDDTQYMQSHQPYNPPWQHPSPSDSLIAAEGLPGADDGTQHLHSHEPYVALGQYFVTSGPLNAARRLPHAYDGTQHLHSHEPYVALGQYLVTSGPLNAAHGLPHAHDRTQHLHSHEPYIALGQYLVTSGQLNAAHGLPHAHDRTQHMFVYEHSAKNSILRQLLTQSRAERLRLHASAWAQGRPSGQAAENGQPPQHHTQESLQVPLSQVDGEYLTGVQTSARAHDNPSVLANELHDQQRLRPYACGFGRRLSSQGRHLRDTCIVLTENLLDDIEMLRHADDSETLHSVIADHSVLVEDFVNKYFRAHGNAAWYAGRGTDFDSASRFRLHVSVPSWMSEGAALDELRRVARLTMDNMDGSLESLHFTMHERMTGLPHHSALSPSADGSLERFAVRYHKVAQGHPIARALCGLTGVNTFFFVRHLLSLIHRRSVNPLPFADIMDYVVSLPLGLGVLDDVMRGVEVAEWLFSRLSVAQRIIRAKGVFFVVRKMTPLQRFTFLTRTATESMLTHALDNAHARIIKLNEPLRLWRRALEDALEFFRSALLRVKSWITEQVRGAPFARHLLRTNLAPLANKVGDVVRGFGFFARDAFRPNSRVMKQLDTLCNIIGAKAKDLGTRFEAATVLQLDIDAERAVLGTHINDVMTRVESVSLRRLSRLVMSTTAVRVLGKARFASKLNSISHAVNEFGDCVTQSLMSPSLSRMSISLPHIASAKTYMSSQVQKFGRFMLRSIGKWGVASKLPRMVEAVNWIRTASVVRLKSFGAAISGFMERVNPALAVLDTVLSVYNFVSALKQLDLAASNRDMMELAVANVVISSVFLVTSTINLALLAVMSLAQAGILAVDIAIVGLMMGVVGLFTLVFMVAAFFTMQYFSLRTECREKLQAFHHYTTTFARQLEQFMKPSESLTTFTMFDTVFDRNTQRNVTQFSYLPIESLEVNDSSYFPKLYGDFTHRLSIHGRVFDEFYGELKNTERVGRLTTVILPLNVYPHPAEHKCGASHNHCTPQMRRRQLRTRIPLSGAATNSLLRSQHEELERLSATTRQYPRRSSAHELLLPQGSTVEQAKDWMLLGHALVKHDERCNEDNWLTYSEVTMPDCTRETELLVRVTVNVPSLTIHTPAQSIPCPRSDKQRRAYFIQINENVTVNSTLDDHQDDTEPLSSAHRAHSILRYTLSIPGFYLRSRNDPDYVYTIDHSVQHDVHWTIEFPNWRNVASLRWEGSGEWDSSVRDDIAAFCASATQRSIKHTWKHRADDGTAFVRSVTFSVAHSNKMHKLGFLIKRGHYQFTVDPRQKTYQMVAITLKDPVQHTYEAYRDESVDIVRENAVVRSTVVAAVLDVLQGYRKSDRTVNDYARGTVPFPIVLGDAAHRPDFYFNPYDGPDRQWSFFCPRWHNETNAVDFAIDCVNDALLPDHTVRSVNISSEGLSVTFDFPELDDKNGTDAMASTIRVLFPVSGVATLISARCPRCDRAEVQTALRRVLLHAHETHGVVTSLTLSPRGLRIEHSSASTRFYHSAVHHRYQPFNATKHVILGYFSVGDCFMLRERFATGTQEYIRIYRANGVSHGMIDDTVTEVAEPDMTGVPVNVDGNKTRRNNSTLFRAAMQTNDQFCPVQAVNGRGDVFCVTCLDVTLMQARSFVPFRYPFFTAKYVAPTRPVEVYTTSVKLRDVLANDAMERSLRGMLLFNNRVFQFPDKKDYRFVAYWTNFKCAVFLHTDNEHVLCVSALPDSVVAGCTNAPVEAQCVITTAPLVARFTFSNIEGRRGHNVYSLDQLHLACAHHPDTTFVCSMRPTTRSLTVDYVTISSDARNEPELPAELQTMADAPYALLYVNIQSGLYFFEGCRINASALLNNHTSHDVKSVLRVVSRGASAMHRLSHSTQEMLQQATFVHSITRQLYRLESDDNGDRCTLQPIPHAFIGGPIGSSDIAFTSEEVVASARHNDHIFMTILNLSHMASSQETSMNVTLPYIRGFAAQKVIIRTDTKNTTIQFVWDEFNAVPADEKVSVSIFLSEGTLYAADWPANPRVIVHVRQMHKRKDVAQSVEGNTATEVQHENRDAKSTCGVCQIGEHCLAKRVCLDPATSFTRHYPRVLDSRFLSSEPSQLAKLYCLRQKSDGTKRCVDKTVLYTLLGEVLPTLTHSTQPDSHSHTVLPIDPTRAGTVCLCGTLACEIDVMGRIVNDTNNFNCDFVLRRLLLPSKLNLLPGVFQAYRLFPEIDALSARGHFGHARLELSRVLDSEIIRQNVAQYRSFVQTENETEDDDMLGCVAQRIAFARDVGDVFLHVTSTCAVHAHDETPHPHLWRPAKTYFVPPYLSSLLKYLEEGKLDIRANDLLDIAHNLLRFALHAARRQYDLRNLGSVDFFCSIYVDPVGQYIYYDPFGGVSFYAYSKLEKGERHMGSIPAWIATLLQPFLGHVAQATSYVPRVFDSLSTLYRLVRSMVAANTPDFSVAQLENMVLRFEAWLSSFPRLQRCNFPVNATLTAERYAMSHFANRYEVDVSSIKLATLDVIAIGETMIPENDSEVMIVDSSCPRAVVTMDMCERLSGSETCLKTTLSLRYDGRRRTPSNVTRRTSTRLRQCPVLRDCHTIARRCASEQCCYCVQCRPLYMRGVMDGCLPINYPRAPTTSWIGLPEMALSASSVWFGTSLVPERAPPRDNVPEDRRLRPPLFFATQVMRNFRNSLRM